MSIILRACDFFLLMASVWLWITNLLVSHLDPLATDVPELGNVILL
jgi:hypothetical protein